VTVVGRRKRQTERLVVFLHGGGGGPVDVVGLEMAAELVRLRESLAARRADARRAAVLDAVSLQRVRVRERLVAVRARVRLGAALRVGVGGVLAQLTSAAELHAAVAAPTRRHRRPRREPDVDGGVRRRHSAGTRARRAAAVPLQRLLRAEDLAADAAAQRLQQSHAAAAVVPHVRARGTVARHALGGGGVAKVHSHVSLERERLREALAAHEAGVGADARVRHHVIVEVVRHGERSTAHVALVRLIAAVKSRVSL